MVPIVVPHLLRQNTDGTDAATFHSLLSTLVPPLPAPIEESKKADVFAEVGDEHDPIYDHDEDAPESMQHQVDICLYFIQW